MKKILSLQIIMMVLISGSLGGMLFLTDIYDYVKSDIVTIICSSCLKLKPKTEIEYTYEDFIFETANNNPHPNFILENLTTGPIFIFFSEDACYGCDIMSPLIKKIFNVNFGKKDIFYDKVIFENSNITFIYCNIDHTSKKLRDSLDIYDKEHIKILPMFVIITKRYDENTDKIDPCYLTLYGAFLDNDNKRKNLLSELVNQSIDLYNQNYNDY